MEDLALLKRIACDYSILIVEDSKHIVAKLKELLSKFFIEIDYAYDGMEGIEKYKKEKYDIVITDINMPKLDGNGFVQTLMDFDPNAQVIVISAFGDDENKVKFNKYGVIDFIQKPINNMQLIKSLLKSIENIKAINVDERNVFFSLDDTIYEKIKKHKDENKSVEFINFFKGVSIIQKGYIKDINKNTLTAKATNSQYYLIKCEKRTVVLIDDLILKTNLQYEDKTNEELIFTKFEQLKRSPKDRAVLRVIPDDDLTLTKFYGGKTINLNVMYLSVNSVSVRVPIEYGRFLEGETIDLVIGFNLHNEEDGVSKPKQVKVKCKANMLRESIVSEKYKKMVFLLSLDATSKKQVHNYVLQRETEILGQLQIASNDM